MTVDRDGGDDAASGLGTPVFRPLPARLQAPPWRSRPAIQPRFLPAPPARVSLGLTPPDCVQPLPGSGSPSAAGRAEDRRWAPRPGRGLRFARFVAAIQAAGAMGPDSGAWGAASPDHPPEPQARGEAGLAEARARFARPGRADWASRLGLRQAFGQPGMLRTAVLAAGAGIASVALIALIAPLELTGGQDSPPRSDLPVLADGLVRAPQTPDRYPPASGPMQAPARDPQLIANLPPDPPAATGLVADVAALAFEPAEGPADATPPAPAAAAPAGSGPPASPVGPGAQAPAADTASGGVRPAASPIAPEPPVPAAAAAATGPAPSAAPAEPDAPTRVAAAATSDVQPGSASITADAPVPAAAAAATGSAPSAAPAEPGAPVRPAAAATGDLRPARAAIGPEAPVHVGAAARSDPAPAPAGVERLSAAVPPTPARIDPAGSGLTAGSKFAAVAVRSAALTEPAAGDDDPLYDLGHRLQQKGDIAQAIEAYRMAAAVNPQHAATYYDWGYLLQQQGDEAGARAKYLETLRYAPHHAFAHYNLGYLCQKHGDYADAIKHYRAAIAANHSFFWSYYNLGYIQQKLGHYREALIDYRKSIAVDPKHALAYENIATILRYHRTD